MSVRDLTDAEIRSCLAKCGYTAGPITVTTRKYLIRKLERLTLASEKVVGSVSSSGAESERGQTENTASRTDLQLIFFDLETSGLECDCDILQISLRSGESNFDRFVAPVKPISPGASAINNFYNRDGALYRSAERLDAQPINAVLRDLLVYLSSFGKKCVLVAHNCRFDWQRLMYHIKKQKKAKAFSQVVEGFADTLELFGRKFPERRGKKGQLTLQTLVRDLGGAPVVRAHDATSDTAVLEVLALQHFSVEEIIATRRSYDRLWLEGYWNNQYNHKNA